MRKTTLMVLLITMMLLATLGIGGALAQTSATATANLQDNEGNPVGSAEFVEGESGVTYHRQHNGGYRARGPRYPHPRDG